MPRANHWLLALILISSAGTASAADSYIVPNGATTTITEHAQCRQITNNKGLGLFVPTKTAAEWSSVYNATTSGLITAACAAVACLNNTWTERTTTPANTAGYALASSANGAKLIAGSFSAGYLYTSNDYGASWTQRTGAGSKSWMTVASSADGMTLAASPAATGYFYTSTDGGATWTERTSPGSRTWYSLAISADGTKMAAGANSSNIYTSSDSGNTWTERTGSGTGNWMGMAISADGSKISALNYGGIFARSNDGGITWTRTTPLLFAANQIASSADGMTLAVNNQNYDSLGYIATSTNGGTTWTSRTSSGSRGWWGIAVSSDGTKMTAASTNSTYRGFGTGNILSSQDSGATWTVLTNAAVRNWTSLAASADGNIVIASPSGSSFFTSICP